MARLDAERERIVLRIVYDGPALAGKTTSLRALAGMFDRPVYSSEDADGRTLHFDWMEYEGGRFERLAVSCQIVTVPGQPELTHRRRALVASADAVIFVADSRRGELARNLEAFGLLRELVAGQPAPRPGIILQANQRDRDDAVPIDELRRRLDVGDAVGVTESVASESVGIRQTFVFAVRLALDRVSEMLRLGILQRGAPDIASGPDLLAELERLEAGGAEAALGLPAIDTMPEPATVSPAPPEAGPSEPRPPKPDVPGGRVWPAVEGRLILHESRTHEIRVRRTARENLFGTSGPWRLHSSPSAVYADVDEARVALMEWARWHTALGRRLSPRRCLTLSDEPGGGARLWQILHREAPIQRQLEILLQQPDESSVARTILEVASALEDAHRSLEGTGLHVDTTTIGLLTHGPAYLAPAPTPRRIAARLAGSAPPERDAASRLAPILERQREQLGPRSESVANRLLELARHRGLGELGESLARQIAPRSAD